MPPPPIPSPFTAQAQRSTSVRARFPDSPEAEGCERMRSLAPSGCQSFRPTNKTTEETKQKEQQHFVKADHPRQPLPSPPPPAILSVPTDRSISFLFLLFLPYGFKPFRSLLVFFLCRAALLTCVVGVLPMQRVFISFFILFLLWLFSTCLCSRFVVLLLPPRLRSLQSVYCAAISETTM